MMLKRLLYLFSPLLGLAGCGTGYQQNGHNWVWTTLDESQGRREHLIPMADGPSFRVLQDKNFALDKAYVYYQGRPLRGADPASFTLLRDGYGKDRNHVFLNTEPVVLADPGSFEILAFPYARDRARVFCGNVPLALSAEEAPFFQVTNTDALMTNTRSTAPKAAFIEFQPEYAWLDTFDIEFVITGPWGTGNCGQRKFKGLKEITGVASGK
jgi:hypothetical protein